MAAQAPFMTLYQSYYAQRIGDASQSPSDPFARQCAYCGQQDFTHKGCNRCGAAEFKYEKKHKKEKNNEIGT